MHYVIIFFSPTYTAKLFLKSSCHYAKNNIHRNRFDFRNTEQCNSDYVLLPFLFFLKILHQYCCPHRGQVVSFQSLCFGSGIFFFMLMVSVPPLSPLYLGLIISSSTSFSLLFSSCDSSHFPAGLPVSATRLCPRS